MSLWHWGHPGADPPCLHVPVKFGTSWGRFLCPCEIWNIPGRFPWTCWGRSSQTSLSGPHGQPRAGPHDPVTMGMSWGRPPCPHVPVNFGTPRAGPHDIPGQVPMSPWTSQGRSWCPCEIWDIPGQVPMSLETALTSAFLNLAFRLFMAAPAAAPQRLDGGGRARGSLPQRCRLRRPQTRRSRAPSCRLRLPPAAVTGDRGTRRGGVGLRPGCGYSWQRWAGGGAGGTSPVWGGGP